LEPRLSTKWISNISFFGTIISLPIPSASFFLPNTNNTLYNPNPPPLQTILSNILPVDVSPKLIFTKGLQSASGLVQHCIALALVKCLIKYAKVLEVFRGIEEMLEMGDTEEGLWGKRRREIEREVRKRVPEFQVIVGFSQQKAQSGQQQSKVIPVRVALLRESAQRLLLLYHMHLPEVVAEARFDVGKALTSFVVPVGEGDEDEDDSVRKLNLVHQLHVLRMLKESGHFVWTNKSCASPVDFQTLLTNLSLTKANSRTYLYTLLKFYTSSRIPALKSTLLDLLTHLLANTVFFQETPTEPKLWLLSLPTLVPALTTTSLEQVTLPDETESVVTFLEDCIQRCLKTPYRYIDDMQKLFITHSTSSEENSDIYPSPLVMTLAEQLEAKLKIRGLLTPSDVLAIVSFLRKLVFRLSSRVRELAFFDAFVGWVGRVIDEEEDRKWNSENPLMKFAIRKEMEMMQQIVNPAVPMPSAPSTGLETYLDKVESLLIREH
jgi:nucleolar pre-ribosomal-associated protein 1